MATRYEKVIVFGPTGAVGGAAALEASRRGAKVWLAMRDTDKPIAGITAEQEQDGKFVRVKADLSDPDAVKQAVEASGAKAAFVYLIHGPGGIKKAVDAMKQAGVEYVVFLSSFTVPENTEIRDVRPEELIPYMHAQGEAALEDTGMAHTALRPGAFASNPFRMSMDASKTPCELYVFGDGKRLVDNIVPKDIGRVAGAVLVDRPSTTSKEVIYLYGPTLMTELEVSNTIKDLSPHEVKVIQQTPEAWVAQMKANGVPQPVVAYLAKMQTAEDNNWYAGLAVQDGTANIKKYSGYEPTSFEDFAKSEVST